jgi:hypothetical protein
MKKLIKYIINIALEAFIQCLRAYDFNYLKRKNPEQIKRFVEASRRMNDIYMPSDDNKFIHPTWFAFAKSIKSEFIKNPQPDFFSCPTILKTMTGFTFYKNANIIVDMLEAKYGSILTEEILAEDVLGSPLLLRYAKYKTSLGRVIHAYQMMCIANANKYEINDKFIITEWGGGYGGLARLVTKIYPNSFYNIIDIPESTVIQYCYLSGTNGEKFIQAHNVATKKKFEKKINLVPNSILEHLSTNLFDCDCFVSTWALSESNEYSINYVHANNYFGAKTLVIANQLSSEMHPHAEDVIKMAMKIYTNINTKEFPLLKDQYISTIN